MKNRFVALFVSIPVAAVAFEKPLGFSVVKIDLPSFSLMEDALQKAPAFVGDFERQLKSAPRSTSVVSRMPIVSPRGDADTGMLNKPDPSIDFKLSVKSPEIEPAK